MKAVWYERTGAAPDVLTFGDMPTPMAGPGEVRVRLEASGVNPADVGRRAGSYRALEFSRVVPNSDGAGIVDQLGDGVTRLSVGQRVWLFNGQRNGRAFGTAAEYIALAEHLVTPLADNVSFAAGATLGIPCMTAWSCLFGDGPIAGQTVLVTGGAGAVGHYAVQLAKWGGARVIATVSSAFKAEQARLAGADLVIDYKTEDVIAKAMAFTERRGVNRVVDVDFGGNIATTLKMMAMNSTIAVYATNGNRSPVVPMRELMERCVALRALVLFALPPPLLAAAQADISKWLAAGTRIHNVAAQFALSETAQAHLAVEKGDKLGTVVADDKWALAGELTAIKFEAELAARTQNTTVHAHTEAEARAELQRLMGIYDASVRAVMLSLLGSHDAEDIINLIDGRPDPPEAAYATPGNWLLLHREHQGLLVAATVSPNFSQFVATLPFLHPRSPE
jgi:NADPH2:quinone reductase